MCPISEKYILLSLILFHTEQIVTKSYDKNNKCIYLYKVKVLRPVSDGENPYPAKNIHFSFGHTRVAHTV